MARVYVAGPVVRERHRYEYGDARVDIYKQIYETLTEAGHEVIIPVLDEKLDNSDPQAFYRFMVERIASSDLVITVLPDLNRSAPVEATMASFMNKSQYIIANEVEQIPRLLRGLPGVEYVAPVEALNEVLSRITEQGPPNINFGWNTGGEGQGGGGLLSL